MGWQDREYARASGHGPTWRGPYASRLIGGSIVTTLIVINVAIYVLGALIPSVDAFLSGGPVATT